MNRTRYILTSSIVQDAKFVTNTEDFSKDGYLAELTTGPDAHLFKKLDKVPAVHTLINCESVNPNKMSGITFVKTKQQKIQ